jgi:hypothetical protein
MVWIRWLLVLLVPMEYLILFLDMAFICWRPHYHLFINTALSSVTKEFGIELKKKQKPMLMCLAERT